MDKRFAEKMCNSEYELLCYLEDAVNNGDMNGVLQAFAENVDFSAPLPHSVSPATCLLVAFDHYLLAEHRRNRSAQGGDQSDQQEPAARGLLDSEHALPGRGQANSAAHVRRLFGLQYRPASVRHLQPDGVHEAHSEKRRRSDHSQLPRQNRPGYCSAAQQQVFYWIGKRWYNYFSYWFICSVNSGQLAPIRISISNIELWKITDTSVRPKTRVFLLFLLTITFWRLVTYLNFIVITDGNSYCDSTLHILATSKLHLCFLRFSFALYRSSVDLSAMKHI